MHYALRTYYALCTMHYALRTTHLLCTMHYALCTTHSRCTMHYALTVHYALRTHYALCTTHSLCTMHSLMQGCLGVRFCAHDIGPKSVMRKPMAMRINIQSVLNLPPPMHPALDISRYSTHTLLTMHYALTMYAPSARHF
jgi:hypothetical protein